MREVHRAATAISVLINPLTNPAVVFIILFLGGVAGAINQTSALTAAVLFVTVIPTGFVIFLKQSGRIGEFDVGDRGRRMLPLAVGIGSFLLGFFVLAGMGIRGIALGFMFCHITNTIIVLAVTRWWKISIHALGISGPVITLQMAFGAAIVPWWGLVPLVCGARVVLGRHTIAQVVAGTLLGAGLTWLQITYIFL